MTTQSQIRMAVVAGATVAFMLVRVTHLARV